MQSWSITGSLDQALGDELLGEDEVPGVEDLDLLGRTPSSLIWCAISRSIDGVFVMT